MMRNNFPVTSKSKSKFFAHQKNSTLKFTFTLHSNSEKRAHTLFKNLKKFTYGLKNHKKIEASKMSAQGRKQKITIHWTDDRKLSLLKCVQQLGGHLIGHSGVTKKWSEINKLFFAQDDMMAYASAYDEKNFRKLKDVYEQTIKAIKQMMINGNTSRFDGDLSVLFNCAKDIIEEIDVHEEEKKLRKKKKLLKKPQWKEMRP
jgi:hypothetical protein